MHFSRSQIALLSIIFLLYTVVALLGAYIHGVNSEFAGYNLGYQRGMQQSGFLSAYIQGNTPICIEGFNVWQAARIKKNIFVTKALASRPLPVGGN